MRQQALYLEYFTVGWNILEGIIAIAAGILAGSIALVGFGIDSGLEVASAAVLIWRLRKHGEEGEEEAAEKRAMVIVGLTLLGLAVYVTYESVKKLIMQERPAESLVGMLLAVVALIVMPILAWQKNKVA